MEGLVSIAGEPFALVGPQEIHAADSVLMAEQSDAYQQGGVDMSPKSEI
jgi:hypothetical protein